MTVIHDIRLAWSGSLDAAEGDSRARAVLFERGGEAAPETLVAAGAILTRVRRDGDRALLAMGAEFDGVDRAPDESLEVPRSEWAAALARVPQATRRVLERATENIGAVHEAFRAMPQEMRTIDGVRIGRRPDPLDRVGVYAPGGRATYPSSLLMGAVPARVAGVGEIIVCSPPQRATRRPDDLILATALIARVDRVFAIGGAGAIGAMAFGTASVPAVARVVGPGNAYVAAAKSLVAGVVGIDAPAGPSELLVIADTSANPVVLANELLAQAEHDPDAAVVCVLVETDTARAESWRATLLRSLAAGVARAPRATIIRAALERRGAVLWSSELDDAVAFATQWAPEHLMLALEPPARARALRDVRHAGTIFLGESSSVAFGDYLTGANHVLPTGGAASRWSGLSPLDFVRWTTWQEIDSAAAGRLASDTAAFAAAEGLPAHATAASQWELK
jgi:histidinol dehydrogenase